MDLLDVMSFTLQEQFEYMEASYAVKGPDDPSSPQVGRYPW